MKRLLAVLLGPTALFCVTAVATAAPATDTKNVTATATTSSPPKHKRLQFATTLRSYSFSHSYQTGKSTQYAVNTGGIFRMAYEFAPHFRFGATYAVADPFGGNSPNIKVVDTSLPGNSISTLAELYGEYFTTAASVKAGRLALNTPWANAADTRLLPVTFQGVDISANAGAGWQVEAARIARWKPRTGSTFESNDLLTTGPTGGFLYLGITRKTKQFTGTLAQYQFYDVAHLTYAEVSDQYRPQSPLKPVASAQWVSEQQLGAHLAGNISSHVVGAALTATVGGAELFGGYNSAPFNGSYHSGGVAVPYTYSSDPLYTTSIATGLYAQGAGWAWKLRATQWLGDRHLRAIVSQAKYLTTSPLPKSPKNNASETDVDLTYFFTKNTLSNNRGFSIRNRSAFLSTSGTPFNSNYDRVQLEYNF